MVPSLLRWGFALCLCCASVRAAVTSCSPGKTPIAAPPLKRIRAFHDQYLYKIEFTDPSDVTTVVGGDGGSPTTIELTTLLSVGEFIESVRYRAFTPDWENYLGCGVSFHTNLGRAITDFVGTYYNDPSLCGVEQTFTADSNLFVVAVTSATAPVNDKGIAKKTITGLVTAPKQQYLCYDCPGGTYKSSTGTEPCTTCPPKSTTSGGAASADACVCNSGYTRDAATAQCTECPVGTYKAAPSNIACTSCGTGRTTFVNGSMSASNCTCMKGYGGPSCGLCGTGKYKPLVGIQECYPCVYGRTSPPGSEEQSACACKSGYVSVTEVPTCQDCPVKIKAFYAQYLYRVIFESQSDPKGVGGAGGTWHEFNINQGGARTLLFASRW